MRVTCDTLREASCSFPSKGLTTFPPSIALYYSVYSYFDQIRSQNATRVSEESRVEPRPCQPKWRPGCCSSSRREIFFRWPLTLREKFFRWILILRVNWNGLHGKEPSDLHTDGSLRCLEKHREGLELSFFLLFFAKHNAQIFCSRHQIILTFNYCWIKD